MPRESLSRAAFLPLFLLAACSESARAPEADPTAAHAPAAAPVKVERPAFAGVITSRVSKVISSEVDAPIQSLKVSVGQRVRTGDVVAKLDENVIKNQIAEANGNLLAAKGEAGSTGAACGSARLEAKREQMLFKRGVGSLGALQAAQGRAGAACSSSASGRIAQAKAALKNAEDKLAKTEIKSPIDGVITQVKLNEGQVVQPGVPIARVFDDRDLLIRFGVLPEQRKLLHKGQRIEVEIEGTDAPIWATIDDISDDLQPPTNMSFVEADIDDYKLRPGQIRVASKATVRIAEAPSAAAAKR